MRRLVSSMLFAALAAGLTSAAAGAQPAPPPPAAPRMSFDLAVVDRDGRVPDGLGPADLTVSVDGKARRVVSLTRISRGPGATTDAASRQARAAGPMAFAAEPVRNVLVVVDQASLVRGEEKAAVAASLALLDRLGMADRLAVVLLPLPQDQMLSLATEQPVARETLARTVGRLDPAAITKPDVEPLTPPGNLMASDPDRLREAERVPVAVPPPTARETESSQPTGVLPGLASLVDALRTVPGRKVVAFFSAGLIDPSPAQLSEVASAAIAARAAIHVFAMPGPRDSSGINLQVAPLEALAKSTGGAFVSPGRNPDRAIARTASELAACYVAELEPAGTDGDGRRHTLRVQAAGRGLIVRAPAWLIPAPDPGDLPPENPAPAGDVGVPPARAETGAKPPRAPEPPSGREAELQLAMARLLDYVDAYERRYSGLVAEEEYLQSTRGKNVRLRSDFLLVKPEKSPAWVSFRDVFEVDGVAVRDRDDRLKRLFLEPGADIQTQLVAIILESARYNIGAVERRLNVPLFLLRFLTPEDRPRSRFRLAGTRQVDGVEAWRVEFEQRSKPTVIHDGSDRDIEAKGWFLVDQITGAILETGLKLDENGMTAEIVVSFRHDPALGMWVPAEMRETYSSMSERSMSGAPRLAPFLEGTASYSNYRRFQVKVDEKIVIPK